MIESNGVPYGNRTRVAAVKEKRITVIQGNLAAWIALYRTSRTQGNAYWTFNGRALAMQGERLLSVTGRRTLSPVQPALPGLKKRYEPVRK